MLRPCAIFSVVDTFVTLRGVDGPASARHVRGTLAFQLTAMGSGAGRQPLAPAWTLPVVQGASGAFISYGTIVDPEGRRSRPIGPPLDVDVTVVGPAYRATQLPPPAAAEPAPAAPQLVNLDPSQPTARSPRSRSSSDPGTATRSRPAHPGTPSSAATCATADGRRS